MCCRCADHPACAPMQVMLQLCDMSETDVLEELQLLESTGIT